uniref:Uncharacterized protein n=1 Tax=Tetranychus urticae TaxID=32264 RepID=T1L5K1_TETUR
MIPAVFKPDIKTEFNRYSDIIVDFTYFKNLESIEAKIDSTPYIFDLKKYTTDLEEVVYIQKTMETVMVNIDGRQLNVRSALPFWPKFAQIFLAQTDFAQIFLLNLTNTLNSLSNPNVEMHWTTYKKCKQSRDVIISETGHDPVKCDMPSNQANKLQSPITSRNPRTLPIITESIMKIGQMQLIKNNISFELKNSCNYQSRNLRSAYETLNEALLTELKRDPKKYLAKEESALVYELTNYLEWSGISDPLSKIYIGSTLPPYMDLVCLVIVILSNPKFIYVDKIHGLTAKKITDSADGQPFVTGLLTLLRQYRCDMVKRFISLLCRYIKSLVESSYPR